MIKDQHMMLRVDEETKSSIEEAARQRAKSVTSFVIGAALRRIPRSVENDVPRLRRLDVQRHAGP